MKADNLAISISLSAHGSFNAARLSTRKRLYQLDSALAFLAQA
jgi:hypothetical protein